MDYGNSADKVSETDKSDVENFYWYGTLSKDSSPARSSQVYKTWRA